jgi:ubiquinol-cytochrome c reductase cytochrome c subunit
MMKNMGAISLLRTVSWKLRAIGSLRKLAIELTGWITVCAAMVVGLLLWAADADVRLVARTLPQSRDSAGNSESGRRLYAKYGCYECHGYEGQGGGSAGPRIGPEPIPLAALIGYVREPAREMPPYSEKVVSDKDLTDIYEFLKSLPHPPVASSNPLLR